MTAPAVERIAGRLLFVRMGPHPYAFAMDRIVGILPAEIAIARAGSAPWVHGRVRYQREDVPFVSLGKMLGYEPSYSPSRGIVLSIGGIAIALSIDEVIGTSGDGECEFHALPAGLSEVPARALDGYALLGERHGFLIDVEALLGEAELNAIGEALFS